MRWPKRVTKCPDWNPYQTFTWERKQLKAWLLMYGRSKALYDGEMWEIKQKHLGFGVYHISFKVTDDWS